jgi:hypothetical protein
MKVRFVAPFMVLFAGFVMTSSLSFAKKEYTAKEKKPCVTCHTAASSKELNETGKYYKDKKTLEGAPSAKK